MSDIAYQAVDYRLNELQHEYGPNVHIVSDPFALTRLARLCTPETIQPEVGRLVRELYEDLIKTVVNAEFPRKIGRVSSRMIQYTSRGYYEGVLVDPDTEVTTVDIARAGMIPSQTCFDALCGLLSPGHVRQDHLIVSRITDAGDKVTGAGIGGAKLAGPIDGRIVLFPDPMGATGSSLSTAIRFYKEQVEGTPRKVIAINLIVTPEFIQRLQADHPEVVLYSYRLDRGLSSDAVLRTVPGTRLSEERGLTDTQYIVPGGGGFGEILNNALV